MLRKRKTAPLGEPSLMTSDALKSSGLTTKSVRGALRSLVGQIDALDQAIGAIDRELAASVKADETASARSPHRHTQAVRAQHHELTSSAGGAASRIHRSFVHSLVRSGGDRPTVAPSGP